MRKFRILIVDDALANRMLMRTMLPDGETYGYEFIDASSGEEGFEVCYKENPDCVLLDYMLGDMTGIDVLRRLRTLGDKTPVIIVTAIGDEMVALEAMEAGAQGFLVKGGFNWNRLHQVIHDSIEKVILQEKCRTIRLLTTDLQENLSSVKDGLDDPPKTVKTSLEDAQDNADAIQSLVNDF